MAYASPTDAYTASDLASMIPEIWSPIVNEPLFNVPTIADFVTDLSPYMVAGGDIVHVPDIYTNTFAVQTQSTQGAGIVDESVASVDTTLTVNTHKYIAWVIGDKDIAQLATKFTLHEKYAREARNLLLQALEDALFGLWSSISTNTIGDTATVLTDLEVRQSIEALATLNFDLSECAFFIHTSTWWNQLLGIAKYYDSSIAGRTSPVVTGTLSGQDLTKGSSFQGNLYSIPVFTSSRVVDALQTERNLLLHRSAFGMAIQTRGGNMIRVQSENRLANLGMLTVVDIIYGVGVLRETGAVLVNSSTSATTA